MLKVFIIIAFLMGMVGMPAWAELPLKEQQHQCVESGGQWGTSPTDLTGRCVNTIAERHCLKRGGQWFWQDGFPGQHVCKEPKRGANDVPQDANSPCKANAECIGRYCVASPQSKDTLMGKCTARFKHSGCLTYIDKGAIGTNCFRP